MTSSQLRTLNFMTIPMLLLMGFASGMGIFNDSIYIRETASFAAQGVGQDIVNLFIGIPIVLISMIYMNKGYKKASWIFAGMIFYYMYSYIIYTFGVRHNDLFLVYCFTLALSTYILIFWIYYNSQQDVKSWFSKAPPSKITGIFILAIAGMFYMLWLKDIIPPLLEGDAPQLVKDNNYAINPVHAIDLSFALPGLIIISFLLFKENKLAYLLTPIVIFFIIILTIALIAMVIMLKINNISDDMSIASIFVFLALIGSSCLYYFLRNVK